MDNVTWKILASIDKVGSRYLKSRINVHEFLLYLPAETSRDGVLAIAKNIIDPLRIMGDEMFISACPVDED